MTDTDGFRETPHPSSVTDGMGNSNTPSVKTHPLRMYQIPHHPYRIGIGGQNPPSVIRSGWYRKMGLGIRGRTDRDGDPKTDRTPVNKHGLFIINPLQRETDYLFFFIF